MSQWRHTIVAKFSQLTLLSWLVMGSVAVAAENRLWEQLRLPADVQGRHLRGVFFLDAQRGWIVGDKGLCLATRDGGATWQRQDTGTDATLRCVQFQDAQTGWICGDGDTKAPPAGNFHTIDGRPVTASMVLHTMDGGKTWKTFWIKITNFEIPCIDVSAAPLLLFGTCGSEGHLDGDILRSTDGGKKGSWQGNRCFRALFAVRKVADQRWVAVGSPVSVFFAPEPVGFELYSAKACRALYSEDDGKSWKVSQGSEGPRRPYLGVGFERGTLKVGQVEEGGPMDKAGVRADDVVVRFGPVQVKSRQELAKSLQKHKPGDKVPLVVERGGKSVPLTVQLGERPGDASLQALAIGKKQAILTVGDKGTILRSEDLGNTWQTLASPTVKDLRSVTWCGPFAVAVGKQGAAILGKEDGKRWKSVSTKRPEALNGVAAAGDYVIVVGEKGLVLRAKLAQLAKRQKKPAQ